MKKTLLPVFLVFFFMLVAVSCSKDGDRGPEGPAGPAGPQGPNGSQGSPGNANVVQYNYSGYNFTSAGFSSVNLQVTTTLDTMNRSAWMIYLVRSSGNTYPIPGWGLSGDSEYRVLWYHSGGKANCTITKHTGPGEEYASIRIVRVYSSSTVTGGRMAQVPDGKDYYQLCRFYGLSTD